MSQEISGAGKSVSVPTAIIIAGALIALAVVFTSSGSSGQDSVTDLQPQDNKRALGEEFYTDVAKDLGVSKKDFASCLDDKENREKVVEDQEEALASGGRGTPYSIIVSADGTMVPVSGALPYSTIEPIIKQAINGELESSDQIAGTIREVDSDDHVFGDSNGAVALIEYSDLECPFCTRFHPTAQQIAETYPDDVKWVYRHFPLDSIHAEATPAAIASECVADLAGNDAFWTFLERIFARE